MIRSRKVRGPLGLLLALLLGCGETTAPEGARADALLAAPMEMTLRAGEERVIGGSVLRLSFGQVLEDSRCPIDAVCVWQGNARVELGIRAGMGPTLPLRLNTSQEPRSAAALGVRVTLVELLPAPRAAEPTRPGDYVVKLRLEADKSEP